MAFLIGGANTLDTTYNVENSCRFFTNTDLKRLPSSTGQSVRGTLSVWVKFCTDDTEMAIIGGWDNSGADDDDGYMVFKRLSSGELQFNGGDDVYLKTTAKYRDVSAWYHIVLAIDSAQNSNNSQRIYVNGSEVTDFATRNNLTNLQDLPMNTTAGNDDALLIGCDEDTGGKGLFFDGYMSEFFWIDSTQKVASDFGKTDSNGVWVPKKYSGTYGTNGVYLEFKQTGTGADASGIGADTSGNTNHFTVTNLTAIDTTTDTPSNNFCTLNILDRGSQVNTVTEGSTKATWNGANGHTIRSTIAVANGKWYWETANADNLSCGIVNTEERIVPVSGNGFPGGSGFGANDSFGYVLSSGKTRTNNTNSDYGEVVDNGEILMCALDLDNGKIFWGVDGTWQNSGDPANGTNPAYTGITTGSVFFSPGWGYQTGGSSTVSVNFGNPPFAISSTQADDNGYGNFEYDVPTGFYALCSKNLAEFG